MIGNTFSQMANAEKLSPQQLQLAIQHGTIPSYIGIPLLQEKMKQSQEAQALAAGQQKPPTIAQQVMQQAQQQGVEALPSNLPAEGMAGGGIVAFADGGMYDEEDTDEDRLDSAREQEASELMDEYARTFQGGIGQLPAAESASKGKESAADFVARIMHKESRGKRYDKEGNLLTSEKGAMGEMQVMPGTVRDPGFGVKAAQSSHPDELARVGRDYAQVMLDRYKDPKIAAIAYNMGPGATDKWLAAGADMSKLPSETKGYVKGFSGEDGKSLVYAPSGFGNSASQADMTPEDLAEAKRLREMGLLDSMKETFGPYVSPVWNALTTGPSSEVKKKTVAPQGIADIPRGHPTMANDPRLIGAAQPSIGKTSPYDTEDARTVEPISPLSTAGKTGSATGEVPDRFADITDILKQRYAGIEKQREQDKYMALLQAGLGMMSGTSPNALANIGAGASQGVQALMAANKDRTAEENALLSGRLGLAKIGAAKEQAEAMMQMRRDLANQTNERLRQAGEEQISQRQASLDERTRKDLTGQLGQMEKLATTKLLAKMKSQIIPGQENVIEAQALEALYADPAYRALYKKVHGMDPMAGTIGSGGGAHPQQIQGILDKYK